PENPGEGGGNADRAGAVAADMQGTDAGGAARGRPGAAAAGGGLRVPGVAGDPGQGAVADRLPAEFRGRGLAENDGAGLAQTRRRRGILGVRRRLDQMRAAPGREAAHQQEVLDRDRYAVERAL